MSSSDDLFPIGVALSDPLGDLTRLGILGKIRAEEIRERVASGDLPGEPEALVDRLAAEKVLTGYQARMVRAGRVGRLRVGPYVLLKPLAKGAMGRVDKAYHPMLGRVVALKRINPRRATRKAQARFRREMRIVGRLDHPNIVVAHDAGRSDNGAFFIAMEYLTGQTLKEVLDERGALPTDQVLGMAAGVARGLAHAHARGIVHRDVKPANLMLVGGDRPRVKILDLGLGCLIDEPGGRPTEDTWGFVGTVDYASPEQAGHRRLDGRSDLYALGCTMYHLIQGRPPFADRSWLERLAIRVSGEHAPIAADLADEPPGLVALMDRLLASNPDNRFPTGDAAAEAMLALLMPGSIPPVLAPARRDVGLATTARRLATAAAVALGVALVPMASAPPEAIESPIVAQATPPAEPAIVATLETPPAPPREVVARPPIRIDWQAPRRAMVRLASLLPKDPRPVPKARAVGPPATLETLRAVQAWSIAPARPAPRARPAIRPTPTEEVTSASATISVIMPTSRSDLIVRGATDPTRPTEPFGARREVTTPALDGTTNYAVRALWSDAAGHSLVRQKAFQIRPGRSYRVDLRPVEPTFVEVSN